jgi:radical SAM/Cys-rich protein
MLNVTLRCDLACAHCHQSCSPSRKEEMSRTTMLQALGLARLVRPALVDVTGGEPELWPHLRELVTLARGAGHAVRVRTNLVALSRPDAADLPAFLAREGVAILASLPGTTAQSVAEQRGPATFDTSLAVLRDLAALGYGDGGELTLDLAYNPPLGEHPRPESDLAERFRKALAPEGARFNTLRAIANVPVGRYRQRLRAEDGLDDYVAGLAAAFNPSVAAALECRHGLTVGWDGTLSDCDFNLGAGMGLAEGPRTLAEALDALQGANGSEALTDLTTRRIAFAPHCFACTADAGSS